jgi:hypothetical protein
MDVHVDFYMNVGGGVGVLQLRWRVNPTPWPVLTIEHGQPFSQQHRRCRRAGPGRGAAGQHDADKAVVRLVWGCGMRRCGGVGLR